KDRRLFVIMPARASSGISTLPAHVGFIRFDRAAHRAVALLEHRPNLLEHAPRGLVGNSKLPLKLLRADAAPSLSHQKDRVKPKVKAGARLVKDRARRRVKVVP